MNIQGQYITKSGRAVKFRTVHYIETTFGRMHQKQSRYLCNKNIVKLVLPDDIEKVYCEKNHITSLTIPSSLEYISCDLMNGIEEQNREGLKLSIWQKR